MTDRPTDPRQPPPRSRLEDEVLEILVKSEKPLSFQDHVRRKARQQQHRLAHQRRPRLGRPTAIGPRELLIGCFVTAFLALLVRDMSPLLAQLLALLSVGLLLAPIVQRFRRPGQSSVKQWRGRDIDLSSPRGPAAPPPPWMTNLRERFRRPPRRF